MANPIALEAASALPTCLLTGIDKQPGSLERYRALRAMRRTSAPTDWEEWPIPLLHLRQEGGPGLHGMRRLEHPHGDARRPRTRSTLREGPGA